MTYDRFKDLTFDKFRELAQDNTLSRYEKIGFPDSYREGKESAIFADIKSKLNTLTNEHKTVVDIGPGCSELAIKIIDLCQEQGHQLILIDSQEMLDHLPNEDFITKIPGAYPRDCGWLFEQYASKVDVVITYSVIQYVFAEANLFDFLDKSLGLLSQQGQMLIGDIPNNSKRKRFFRSAAGILHHQQFTGTKEIPNVEFNILEPGSIDDSVVMAMLLHCRSAGFDAYVLPQALDLPMANRREDILIQRP
jgi:hypothetical protein